MDDNDLEADFEEWDYADETMGDEAKERPLDTPSPRRNSVTSYVARRKGRLVEWRPDGSAFVKWCEGDRFAHALVRVLKLPLTRAKPRQQKACGRASPCGSGPRSKGSTYLQCNYLMTYGRPSSAPTCGPFLRG